MGLNTAIYATGFLSPACPAFQQGEQTLNLGQELFQQPALPQVKAATAQFVAFLQLRLQLPPAALFGRLFHLSFCPCWCKYA